MEKKLIEKKKFIDTLYYAIGRQIQDIEFCGTYGDRQFTKWVKYSEAIFPIDFDGTCDDWKKQKFFEQINQRQILSNEVVLDLEEKEEYPKILNKLIKEEFYFIAYETGSRGMHVSLFFDKVLDEAEKLAIIRYFNCDLQKNAKRTMIALEYAPHWKTGRPKKMINENMYNGDEIGSNKLVAKNEGSDLYPHIVYNIKKSNKTFNY